MNYTELTEDMDIDCDLVSKLHMIRNATLPDVQPSPDDPALEHMQAARGRYLDCINGILRTTKFIESKQTDLDIISELLKKMGPAVGTYKDTLSNVLSDFETNEGLAEAKTELAQFTADYMALRKVFELVEEPSRYLCFTCLDRYIDLVYVPCGHAVCTPCSDRMTTCPFCRSPIMNRQRIFLA